MQILGAGLYPHPFPPRKVAEIIEQFVALVYDAGRD